LCDRFLQFAFASLFLSTKYARQVYAANVGEFKGVSRHWKTLLGCGVVTLIVFIYSLRYQSSWPLIIWVILLACLFAAAFLAWRDKK
jgi:cobalamin synthase